MTKVTLMLDDFKTLASGTRLNILRALDGKKMNLNEICNATKLQKMTVHENLSKLVESDFIKKIEREGHKWVYYKLSWKGASLLHPENTKVVVLFSFTFITLFFGIVGLINFVLARSASGVIEDLYTFGPSSSEGFFLGQQQILLYIAICCLIIFIVLMSVSIWRYKKNKTSKL